MFLDEKVFGQVADTPRNGERSFRCPHCDLLFGWTDGRDLRTPALIFTERVEISCFACGESYEWSPTPD